jgi:hypothetical protein
MDPITIGLLAGGGLGLLKGFGNKQKDIDEALTRKAMIMYSPWTKLGDPGKTERPDELSSMLGGAAQGAMMGNMLGKAGAAAPAAEAPVAAAPSEAAFQSAQSAQAPMTPVEAAPMAPNAQGAMDFDQARLGAYSRMPVNPYQSSMYGYPVRTPYVR